MTWSNGIQLWNPILFPGCILKLSLEMLDQGNYTVDVTSSCQYSMGWHWKDGCSSGAFHSVIISTVVCWFQLMPRAFCVCDFLPLSSDASSGIWFHSLNTEAWNAFPWVSASGWCVSLCTCTWSMVCSYILLDDCQECFLSSAAPGLD